MKNPVEKFGNILIDWFIILALFVIGATIVWSAVYVYIDIMQNGRASLDDILLLFIYLELGAMVGIFFKTNKLPTVFLIYIGITAITRYVAIDLKELPVNSTLMLVGAIFILVMSAVALQVVEAKYQNSPKD